MSEEKDILRNRIRIFREKRKLAKEIYKKTFIKKPQKKIVEAINLPKVLNMNPRSIYNIKEELSVFIKEETVDVICVSESWEREGETLEKVIKVDDYKVISNVYQRKEKGGRPAIIANASKYEIENLTNTVIKIPWGVEIVWAVLTPKNVTRNSEVKKIVVAAVYCKPRSRKKTLLLDHIAQVYNLMCSKYKNGLHWIICGDTNDLRLDPILALSPNMKQVVESHTRMNPPRLLDPIITTLSKYYQVPQVLPPLDPDPNCGGKPSDHLMVVFTPINTINRKCANITKQIKFRPLSDIGMYKMEQWLKNENWNEVLQAECADVKASTLQNLLMTKFKDFFPEKVRVISNNDQPFFTNKLKRLKRKKIREYQKHRQSIKWKQLETKYQHELSKAKKDFYKKRIKALRKGKPGKWYSELKKLTNYEQTKSEDIIVDDIKDLEDLEQAEIIADKFSEVANEYQKLKTKDIEIPEYNEQDIPKFEEKEVESILNEMDTNKSNVNGDFPIKLLKKFSIFLAKPITDMINSSVKQGIWPEIFKMEIVTPVPKQYPPKSVEHLRNISGLLNLDKVAEKLISRLMIADMKRNIDPSQYANQKGLSIQHYLLKFIDRILQALDKNNKKESCAVLATLVDWKQAFSRQCPKLGIESFVKNGVRPSLIPLLINYFQNRKMKVKWHGQMSSERDLNGSGPQGSSFGLWEYLSQSNDNADCVEEENRFKFVDDLSFLEIIFLFNIGLASYNVRSHVPSDVPTHNQIIEKDRLQSQSQLEKINEWTEDKKMKLNVKKTKNMIFNFTKKYQFTTKLSLNNENIEMVREARLLGTIITDQLTWDRNTDELTKKCYKRMQLLNAAAAFTSNKIELKNIYLTYIRSIAEQSAVVWHSSLSGKNRKDLERIQKVAVRIIMGNSYKNYNQSLNDLKMITLERRREILSLRFAKNCLKHEKMKNLFPINKRIHKMEKRRNRKFEKKKIYSKRYEKSALPYMIELLNKDEENKRKIITQTE